MKCLEKRPADRWQSAAELLAQVEAAAAESTTPAGIAVQPNHLVERRFVLTERVCRKLDREMLDPRIIGDHLQYVDNQVASDVLVFFLHGLGLDHRDFEPVLQRLPYHGLSPTLYGGEPGRQLRLSLSLADHIVILHEWLADVVEHFQPSIIVMVGFSLGADMGFELLRTMPAESPRRIDAFLSLGSNLSHETCFVSRVMAGLRGDQPEKLVADLCRLGSGAASLDEWVNIHEYLVKVLRKFQGDIGPLQRSASDIVRPFAQSSGFEVFARWFKTARERLTAARLVFSGDSQTQKTLNRLKLENLDSRILGEEYPDRTIVVLPHADHFELMATDHVLRFVGDLVGEVRAHLIAPPVVLWWLSRVQIEGSRPSNGPMST
jgi:pimeloyl-ACP methyl ester carboxylesterase